ncbi:hypothetical protein [Antarctobacter jejuensis]|uniref:hypothetical protein n=1 Tax=Antarctobacter jejuensis TaxID=1439938 RepID=UPI003FD11B1E
MAVFSYLVSSLFGLVSALICWLFFGFSALAALGLYLSLSVVVGTAFVFAGMLTLQSRDNRTSFTPRSAPPTPRP